jgi:hypothetical protein
MIPLALMLARPLASIPVTNAMSWLARFGTRVLARRLDVPEIVVHAICIYVAAYVSEVERNATLVCPIRVFRELRRNRTTHRTTTSAQHRPLRA